MAAANVLTTGTTAASSADQTITADTVYGLKGAGDSAHVLIEQKDDLGAYNLIGTLAKPNQMSVVLAAGTYRFTRPAGPSCGVYSG